MELVPLKFSIFLKTFLNLSKNKANKYFKSEAARFCPVCEKSARRFYSYGWTRRKDARCGHCGALERHRLLWLFISEHTNFFDKKPKKMLHIAPESCFKSRFKQHLGDHYLTADLYDPRADLKMDITSINYPENYFDIIYCSHVLEHIQEDIKAMKELYRTLKHDGWAILLVPISTEKTFEDTSISNPISRWKAFGQIDHVRRYGLDYADRLKEAGFIVDIIKVDQLVQQAEAIRMGLTLDSGDIYYCTKKHSSQ